MRRLLLVLLLVAGCATPRPAETVIPTSSPQFSSGLSRNLSVPTGAPLALEAGNPADPTPSPTAGTPRLVGTRVTGQVESPQPSALVLRGVLAHMGTAPVGPRYAAIPWGPGVRVRICARRCVTVVSADTGPSLAMQRAGRVADVSVALFVAICGKPASAGLCVGTIEEVR